MTTVPPLLALQHISRHFQTGDDRLTVLDNINLDIHAGEMVAIIGASGSGKSTLMNILGCLDRPSHGEYRVNGQSTATLNSDQLADLRRDCFGGCHAFGFFPKPIAFVATNQTPLDFAQTNRLSTRHHRRE